MRDSIARQVYGKQSTAQEFLWQLNPTFAERSWRVLRLRDALVAEAGFRCLAGLKDGPT